MRHKKNILFYFLLCMAVAFTGLTPMTVYGAADWPSEVAMEADGGILMDADTGTILYGKNINEAYYPASITKLLTAQVYWTGAGWMKWWNSLRMLSTTWSRGVRA